MLVGNLIFSCSYWRIFKKSDSCVLCFYQFRKGESHKLVDQVTVARLYQAFDYIDLVGSYYPVIITTDGCCFSF